MFIQIDIDIDIDRYSIISSNQHIKYPQLYRGLGLRVEGLGFDFCLSGT
jgi:hypothetical protein